MTLDGVNIVDVAARFDGSPVELAAKLDEVGDQLLIQTRDWATRLQLRILDEFGPALQQYQLLLYVHAQLRHAFLVRYADSRAGQSAVPEAVVTLVDRSAFVAEEILVLCGAGMAAGALTRWRTLHELSVITIFVLGAGDETRKRYTTTSSCSASGCVARTKPGRAVPAPKLSPRTR